LQWQFIEKIQNDHRNRKHTLRRTNIAVLCTFGFLYELIATNIKRLCLQISSGSAATNIKAALPLVKDSSNEIPRGAAHPDIWCAGYVATNIKRLCLQISSGSAATNMKAALPLVKDSSNEIPRGAAHPDICRCIAPEYL